VPVIDTPKIVEWPTDTGNQEPSLSEPTANLFNDLHADISQCDMVIITTGNYHMALKELWELYLTKFPADDRLRNWYYTSEIFLNHKMVCVFNRNLQIWGHSLSTLEEKN
jgi:hypothetical protein